MDRYAGMHRVEATVCESEPIAKKAKKERRRGALAVFFLRAAVCLLLGGSIFALKAWGGKRGEAAASAVKDAVTFDAVSYVAAFFVEEKEESAARVSALPRETAI